MSEEGLPEPKFSFEKNKAKLPTWYRASDGREVEIRLMDDGHLYLAWRWWFGHRGDSDRAEYVYEALQREKERRRYIRDQDIAYAVAQGFPVRRRRRRKPL